MITANGRVGTGTEISPVRKLPENIADHIRTANENAREYPAAARACRLPPSVSRLCSASISHASLTTSVDGLFPISIASTTGSEVVFDLGVGLVAENRWFERWRGAGVVQSSLKDVVFVSLAFSRRSISNSHSFLMMRLPHVTPSGGSSVVKLKSSSCFKSFREPFTSSKVT